MRHLRIGALAFALEGADLRYVRFGDIEIVRRLHIGVRDDRWGTLEATLDHPIVRQHDDWLSIRFAGRHTRGAIALDWTAEVEARASGALRYRLEAVAATSFTYNRIGICVLHPIARVAGQPCRWRAPDGVHTGELPAQIGPQTLVDGVPQPLVGPFSELEIELAGLGDLRFRFEGDLFELEDQRNWTDASFKTYSTPLALRIPHHAEAGRRFAQLVEIEPTWQANRPTSRSMTPASITIGEPVGRLPPIGLVVPSDRREDEHDQFRLVELRPSHLRVDLEVGGLGSLARAEALARAAGARLEVALRVGGDEDFERTAGALSQLDPAPVRVLLLPIGDGTTPSIVEQTLVPLLRQSLPGIPLVGGTGSHLVSLNNRPLDLGTLDGVAYGIDPQVHASDDLSIMETPEVQGETVHTARALARGLPVSVGPILLGRDDPRQASALCAAWALATIDSLATAGAASISIFETTGPSSTGDRDRRYPVHHLLAALAGRTGATVLAVKLPDQFACSALALRTAAGDHAILANARASAEQVRITWSDHCVDDVSLAPQELVTFTHTHTHPSPATHQRDGATMDSLSCHVTRRICSTPANGRASDEA